MPHECRVLSRSAVALALLLCVALSDGWAQVTNPVTLYRDNRLLRHKRGRRFAVQNRNSFFPR
jgi:hypothetical protein